MKKRQKGHIATPVVVSCRLSEGEALRLHRLARQNRVSVNRTLRRAIAAYEPEHVA